MRRIGNEYLFQMLAQQNVETMNGAGREEDRRHVPALPQHAEERVPGVRRAVRGRPPHRAARRPAQERPAPAGGRTPSPARSPTTTPATSAAIRSSTRRRATCCGAVPGVTVSSRSARAARASVAAPAAAACGWKRRPATASTSCASASCSRPRLRSSVRRPHVDGRRGRRQRRRGARRPALETSPDLIGVNCPYCLTMMEDGLGSVEPDGDVRVMDLAEILAGRLRPSGHPDREGLA